MIISIVGMFFNWKKELDIILEIADSRRGTIGETTV